MGNKLYVGNLPYKVRDNDLAELFSPYGEVSSAKVMMERGTDRSKGFGFVEMDSPESAQTAIKELNDKVLHERALRVSLAQDRPQESRGPGGGGGRGDGGGFRRTGGSGGRSDGGGRSEGGFRERRHS